MESSGGQQKDRPIKTVLIAGGGIGGLVLAHLLRTDPSISITVFERDTSPEARTQGYVIGLQSSGLQVVREKLLKICPAISSLLNSDALMLKGFAMLTAGFWTMMRFTSSSISLETRLVSRWGFRAVLAAELPPQTIQWNKKVARYEETTDAVTLYFEDGTSATGDLLVGADGARSVIRAQRIPSLVVKEVGVANFGGEVPLSGALATLLAPWRSLLMRVLGKNGHSLLIFTFANAQKQNMIAWSMSWPKTERDVARMKEWRELKNNKRGKEAAQEDAEESGKFSEEKLLFLAKMQAEVLQMAKQHFKEQGVQLLITSTHIDALFPPQTVKSMEEPPAPTTYAAPSRVILIGDAAHAMTTQRGLGANTALEDAAELAAALTAAPGASVASLRDVQGKVFTRGFAAVASSLQTTRSIHARGWRAVMRDIFVWCLGTLILPPIVFYFSLKQRWSTGKNKTD